MRRGFLAGLALLAAGCLASGPGADDTTAADEQAVRDANAAFYRALNAMFTGDILPMRDVWSHADDVAFMSPAGGVIIGWSNVSADWDKQAALKMGGAVVAEDLHVFVGRDLSVVVDVEKGENMNESGQPQSVSIRATNVYRKENGAWKLVSHQTDLLPFLAK